MTVARVVMTRMMVVGALMAAVLLGTAAAASATPGIDPFRPIASGTAGSVGGSSSPTTTPTTTAGAGGGSGTTTGSSSGAGTTSGPGTVTGSGTSSSGTAGTTGSLPFTGSHTMATFLLGLLAIVVGAPMVRAGRRWFNARHWPAC